MSSVSRPASERKGHSPAREGESVSVFHIDRQRAFFSATRLGHGKRRNAPLTRKTPERASYSSSDTPGATSKPLFLKGRRQGATVQSVKL